MTRSMKHFRFLLFVLGLANLSHGQEDPPRFETDIQPILARKCGKCHRRTLRKGGLDLSSIAGLRRGGESEEPIVSKKLDDSLLWTHLESGEMPPAGQPRLTDQELGEIRRWIVAGAPSDRLTSTAEKKLNQHDVLPIVLLRCTVCHGPRLRQGGLDLRTPAAMRKGGQSGPAIVPGDPEGSLLIQRIESEACPPRELLLKFFVRRPPKSEVRTLRDWIASGAPEEDIRPDIATTEPDPLVSDEDRRHWAFQPPKKPASGNSIDEFLLRKLQQKGLAFSPPADRDTLIRRAHLDLLGIPPTRSAGERWRNDNKPDWYSRMIDELLRSPSYGEHAAKHWLDVAGYADSEGGISADPIRSAAWKYRDYVIRAFHQDKPYDRFLLEQIAGDELRDYEKATTVDRRMVENLVATGFLRMGIDQTGSRTMNFVPERLGVIHNAISVLGSGVMGLTLECARCHSHKYDPLPQRDYYRFKAILQGAYDEYDWLTFKNRSLPVPASRKFFASAIKPEHIADAKRLRSQRNNALKELRLAVLRHHYPKQPEADRQATLAALKKADNTRTQTQRLLVEMLQRGEARPDEKQSPAVLAARESLRTIDRQIALAEQAKITPNVRALWDRGAPSPTYILRRGEHDKPGRLVGPGVPSVLTDGKTPFAVRPPFPGGTPKTGRRLALAKWLVRPDHPLTARVMVNRLWRQHFAVGLVKSLENFGAQGERPSHPELLDWLAVRFVEEGWSIQAMHRLMMNSRAYRQSSRVDSRRKRLDPQNRLLSRMPIRRMDAETLRDSILAVSGLLDETRGGPPDPVSVERTGLVRVEPTPSGRWRRSIYAQHRRTTIPTMLDSFDYPEMGPNCIARSISTVSPQALMLLNDRWVRQAAGELAQRLESEGRDLDFVGKAYGQILHRPPTIQERRLGEAALKELQAAHGGDIQAALKDYCHTLLNSAAFIYID